MKAVALFACLVCCVPTLAKTESELQTAKVISQDIEANNRGAAAMPVGTMVVAVPIVRRSNRVVVETGNQRLTWAEAGNGKNVLVLPVNGTIHFYRDGNWFVVVDSQHKKHKFGLVHEEIIQTEAGK